MRKNAFAFYTIRMEPTQLLTDTLTEQQRALLPTDEDVRAYREKGWYLSKPLFTTEEMDRVLAASERFYAGEVDEPTVDAIHLERYRPQLPLRPGLRKHDYSSMFSRDLRWLVTHPLIGAIAARLAETPEIRLWHDQLLYKPTQSPDRLANVGWHTDRGYWKTCTSANMVTAWIPFHDCDTEMGTIAMVDGSLHWPDNTEQLNFFSNDLEGLEKKFETGGRPVVKTPLIFERGQVSFHHCLTIHGSGPNHKDEPRRSIAIHLQDQSNRWQEYHHPDGRLAEHDNDRLVRKVNGIPDYTDPDFCPALYRTL